MNATKEMFESGGAQTILDEGYVAALDKKWGQFLEGIPARNQQERHTRSVAAILMENQSRSLREMTEETRSTNVGSFTKFIFPILRRVFPNLIANELVSVQPMTGPVGAVFYMDYVYSTTKGPTTTGNTTPEDFDKDYTSEFINGELLATGNGTDYGGGGSALAVTLGFTPVRDVDTDRGFSVVIKELTSAGVAVQTATMAAGGASFVGDVAAGALNLTTGAITGFLFTAAVTNGNQIKAYYFYDGEMNTQQPTLSLNVRKKLVSAEPRRLKSLWSSEAAEDLRALHGVDAEAELVSTTASEISQEIDQEVVNDLFAASTGTSASFDRIPPAGIPEIDHLRSMLTQIATVSNLIHKKTLRAPANFIVTSPEISALLAQLTTHGDYRAAFVSNPDNPYGPADQIRPMTQHGQFGIYKTGTLMNKWTLYEDPHFNRDQMLIGLKGATYMDSGYAWAPYIPLQITATFLDPSDMSFRKAMRTRYGKALLRPEYYGQMRVLNL